MRRATSCASASRKCVVVLHTNAYALLNPDRREAIDPADNGLCNDAGPISGFGRHTASLQSLFPNPGRLLQ